MKMRSVMSHAFSMVPRAEIPRSSFDRSHGHKTTFDGGFLVPIFVDEALPGDTFNLSMTGFARMATPIFPVMDNMYMETFFFAVPYRLLWDNWEKFCGSQDSPGDSTDFVVPVITLPAGGVTTGSLLDYFGWPVGVQNVQGSALPLRAYSLIWNEWFRDQNLQNSIVIDKDDGPDVAGVAPILLRRGKRHDYFTSCLPWPQKGDAVTLPLGTSAPVIPENAAGNATSPTWVRITDNLPLGGTLVYPGAAGNLATVVQVGASVGVRISGLPGDINSSGMVADLSEATAATINQLRQAFQVQKLLERDARGGTRYTEIVRSHFGVISPDARLQRPEYLGGGSSPVNIVAVAQTSESAGTPQGNLSGYGTATLHNHGFVKSFTEHCVVLGFVNVRADLTYQQGLNRMWSRQTRFDFYWPALSHIGEQAVLSKEIFADGTAGDEDVFGYQERYAEYRYKPSMLTGLMRSNPTTGASLDPWHLSIDFAARPLLNAAFIVDNPPIDRVIAVLAEPHFIFDGYFRFNCARPMPLFGVPGMIDHF